MTKKVYCIGIKDRKKSFWYFNENKIAHYKLNDREILVSIVGNIKVKFDIDGIFYKNEQAVDKALELNLYDSDLDFLEMANCCYFDFLYRTSENKYWEDITGDEQFEYDLSIKLVEEYLRDENFWKQF